MLRITRQQIALARRLLVSARRRLSEGDPFAASEAVISAQDAIELLLVAIAEERKIGLAPNDGFHALLKKLAGDGDVSVFVSGLDRLNHQRVGIKHKGMLQPEAAARDVLEHAQVALRVLTEKVFGIDVDRVSLASWLEHRGIADALTRAENGLDAWSTCDRSVFINALAEALYFARAQARWIVGVIPPRDFARELREVRGGDRSRAVDRLASAFTQELKALIESVEDLRMGIDPVDAALWNEYLPRTALTHAGRFNHISSLSVAEARFDEATARRLYLSLLGFAERLDGRHPALHLDGLRTVRAVRDEAACFGSGEHEREIGRVRAGHLYRVFPGAKDEREIELFGLCVEVPRDAFE